MAPYKPYSAIILQPLLPHVFSVLRHFARRFWNQTYTQPNTTKIYIYTVSQKNILDISHIIDCNLKKDYQILIVFDMTIFDIDLGVDPKSRQGSTRAFQVELGRFFWAHLNPKLNVYKKVTFEVDLYKST